MASPFNIFRKRQKLMLAILGVLAMLAFVVLPPLLQSQGQRAEGADPEVARTRYGVLRQSDVRALLSDQAIARSFAASVGRAGGNPFVDQQLEQQWGDGRDERFAVQRMLLARKAEDMGMTVGNEQVEQFIRDLTGDQVEQEEIEQLILRTNAPQARVFDALRRQLLADRLQEVFAGYFQPSRQVIATPAEQWEYYRRLHRRVQAEVAALPAARFVDEVADPGDAELEAYFAKYADRTPSKLSPEPGFRVPLKAAFTYLKADFDKAVEAAQVTDEEVAAYYEENRDFYKNPELPYLDEGRDEGGAERPTIPNFRLPASLEGSEWRTGVGDALGESPDHPDDLPAEEPATHEEAPADAETEPADEADADGDCQPADVEPADVGDSLRESPDAADDEPATETATDEEPAASSDEADAEAPPADVGDSLRESPDAAGDEPATETADDLPVREDLDAPPPTRPVYKPLSEVQDQIRNSLKRTKAREQLDAAAQAVLAAMNGYYEKLLLNKAGNQDPPPLPDLQALAAAHNMTLHETGLLSQQEIYDQVDLGKSFLLGRQPLDFTQYAYHSLQEFQPGRTQDDTASRFVFWKTRQEEEQAASLADAETRRHVVRTWKLEQARDPARKRAEELAALARKSGGSLREALAGEPGIVVTETGEFTWMTDPFQQGPRQSEVHGVEYAGPDFMRSVFALSPGEVGVAVNLPQDTVYVVRVASAAPSTEVLQSMFAATQFGSYQQVAYDDFREVLYDWAQKVTDEAGLEWLPAEEPAAEEY